jgi:4-hydroxybenzoate polyprenyltransferase
MARVSSSPSGSAAPLPRASRFSIRLLFDSLRPEQWTKNLLVLAGVVFGGRLTEPHAVVTALATLAIFCVLSGAIYLFNDIADRNADRSHPLKRQRPVASGRLSVSVARATSGLLAAGGLAAAFAVNRELGFIAGAYAGLLALYSIALKHVVIVDVLIIAAGFVLRAIAGAVAVDVPIGHWLLVCTTLLALFLALSKRRHEITLLAEGATDHRPILEEYSPYLLDQMIGVVTSSTLIAYTVYATSLDTAARLGTGKLGLTIPFVLYGIFRYLYLVHQKRGGGSPAAMLLTDRPLLACVGLWAISVIVLLYSPLGK